MFKELKDKLSKELSKVGFTLTNLDICCDEVTIDFKYETGTKYSIQLWGDQYYSCCGIQHLNHADNATGRIHIKFTKSTYKAVSDMIKWACGSDGYTGIVLDISECNTKFMQELIKQTGEWKHIEQNMYYGELTGEMYSHCYDLMCEDDDYDEDWDEDDDEW